MDLSVAVRSVAHGRADGVDETRAEWLRRLGSSCGTSSAGSGDRVTSGKKRNVAVLTFADVKEKCAKMRLSLNGPCSDTHML